MSNGISYSRELVDAAKQYARNVRRMTQDQYISLLKFQPDGNLYKASAEILLNLLEGAEVHDKQPAKPNTCGECAHFDGTEFMCRNENCDVIHTESDMPDCGMSKPREEGGKK